MNLGLNKEILFKTDENKEILNTNNTNNTNKTNNSNNTNNTTIDELKTKNKSYMEKIINLFRQKTFLDKKVTSLIIKIIIL